MINEEFQRIENLIKDKGRPIVIRHVIEKGKVSDYITKQMQNSWNPNTGTNVQKEKSFYGIEDNDQIVLTIPINFIPEQFDFEEGDIVFILNKDKLINDEKVIINEKYEITKLRHSYYMGETVQYKLYCDIYNFYNKKVSDEK